MLIQASILLWSSLKYPERVELKTVDSKTSVSYQRETKRIKLQVLLLVPQRTKKYLSIFYDALLMLLTTIFCIRVCFLYKICGRLFLTFTNLVVELPGRFKRGSCKNNL